MSNRLKPHVFVSYSRKDGEIVAKICADLNRSGIDCWIDVSAIRAGDRLKEAILGTIPQCNLFFAYMTESYLASRWCMDEVKQALHSSRVMVALFADSQETVAAIPEEIRDEIQCGVVTSDNYWNTLMELSGKAWESLQTVRRLVPSEDHILTGPAIFDSAGFRRSDLISRARRQLILAAPNLRSWLSDPGTKHELVEMVKHGDIDLTLILATYETLRPVSAEGAAHLRQSVEDLAEMRDLLRPEERKRMAVHFHIAASTLSAVFVDPESPDGILFFNPRWAIQFLPQDRLTCVIDKTVNSVSLYKAIYNGVLLMTQRDALSLDDMLARPWTG